MGQRELVGLLLGRVGGSFSEVLGINLEEGSSEAIFKWFIASLLFGVRISERIAMNTYEEFAGRGILTVDKILATGWDGLVEILDVGGYVRYDFKTATKLLDIVGALKSKYGGDLNLLHERAKDRVDLEGKLSEFKGVGPTTVNIFLRELRGIWAKAEPELQDFVILGARNLGLTAYGGKTVEERQKILEDLKSFWAGEGVAGARFADLEVSLLRLGKNYCHKRKCEECPVGGYCER